MAILNKGTTYASGDNVTAANLNTLVDSATFKTGSNEATDNSTLQVHGSGYLKIKDLGVGSTQIADDAVITAKIADSTGTTDGVTSAKLATDSVTEAKIADNAVTTAKIKDSTGASDGVTTSKLATDAVTSAKISSTDTTFKVSSSDVVINDAGGDIDFRVEGDNNANLLLTDASVDKVSIRGAIGSVGETTIHGGLEMKDGNIQISRSNTGAGIRMEETTACSSPNQQSDIIMSIPDGSIVFTKPQKASNQTTHKFEPDGDTLSLTGSYGTISDRDLKENIIYLTDEQKQAQVEDIKKVKFAKYNLIGNSITQLGVIAQDLKETSPGLVKGEEGSLSVKQSILHQKAVVALQVALDKIEALEARIALLES